MGMIIYPLRVSGFFSQTERDASCYHSLKVTYFAISDMHYTVDCKIPGDLLHFQYSVASGTGTI